MSASKSRKARHSRDPSVTAQPKPLDEEIRHGKTHESGLSIDPEDLGTQFLNDATDQDNFESSEGEEALPIAGNPPSDEPLLGPTFETEHSVWEQTADLAQDDPEREELRAPPFESDEDSPRDVDSEDQEEVGAHAHARSVDTRQDNIEEASLFDHITDEEHDEDTEEPDVNTDDQE